MLLASATVAGRFRMIALATAALWVALPYAYAAEDVANYPSKPIRIVIGFSAGSSVDLSARVIGARLAESWRQPVVADNRPGAGGAIAAQIVAKANPDGYTLISVSAAHVILPVLSSKPPYDPRDFAGITTTVAVPSVLVVSPSLAVKSVKDLIAMAKAKPGELLFSSGGVGSSTHFAGELFKSYAAIDVRHVPFKGIPEALTEAMVGRVHFTMSPVASVLPLAKAGKVVALAITPAKRSSAMPDVPTLAESGVPGYRWDTWFGLLAPAKTPRPVIRKLHLEVSRILVLPDIKKHWDSMGAEPLPISPEEFDKYIAEQTRLVTKLAKAANIRID